MVEKCFIIMPFGKKIVEHEEIDFDQIYKSYIFQAERSAKLDARFKIERADSAPHDGLISSSMIKKIYEASLVIADITYHNPNVFYELGVRHALRRTGTILVRRAGGDLGATTLKRGKAAPSIVPFDIKDCPVVSYHLTAATLEPEIEALSERMSLQFAADATDSPVFHHLPELKESLPSRKALSGNGEVFAVAGAPNKFVGYLPGDIADLHGRRSVDYWVNSENHVMQMSRMYERTVSATIRYLGAREPDPAEPEFEDTIADLLERAMGNRRVVDLGTVLVTDPGRLAETHNVRKILHAATVTGTKGHGWQPPGGDQIGLVVRNVIRKALELNRGAGPVGRSLLMPIFGAGQGQRTSSQVVVELLRHVVHELRHGAAAEDPGRELTQICVAAYFESDVAILAKHLAILADQGVLARVDPAAATAERSKTA